MMSAGTFFMVAFSHFFPDIAIWQFYIGLVLLYSLFVILSYVFYVPSAITFSNLQAYKHENPIRKDLAEVLSRLESIEKKMNTGK
jgi:hypothetical protein